MFSASAGGSAVKCQHVENQLWYIHANRTNYFDIQSIHISTNNVPESQLVYNIFVLALSKIEKLIKNN